MDKLIDFYNLDIDIQNYGKLNVRIQFLYYVENSISSFLCMAK